MSAGMDNRIEKEFIAERPDYKSWHMKAWNDDVTLADKGTATDHRDGLRGVAGRSRIT